MDDFSIQGYKLALDKNLRESQVNQLKRERDAAGVPSVVLAFEQKWESPLRSDEVSVVFRKKGPVPKKLGYLYVYAGLPTSGIIGRAKITKYEKMSVSDAVKLASKGKITGTELRNYAGMAIELGVFRLGSFESAKSVLAFQDLVSEFGFTPPQNFFFLSDQGKRALDKLAGFKDSQ